MASVSDKVARLSPKLRERLLVTYNSQAHHAVTADPFKLALFKLMGKFDQQKRSVPYITATTEDWMWLQLFMVMCLPTIQFSLPI
jgi:nuclear pore complex protein Nup93